jgi:hypothetical protein
MNTMITCSLCRKSPATELETGDGRLVWVCAECKAYVLRARRLAQVFLVERDDDSDDWG